MSDAFSSVSRSARGFNLHTLSEGAPPASLLSDESFEHKTF